LIDSNIKKKGRKMEYSAILHHMDKRYCYAIEKGTFLFRIQTKRDDIESVILHYQDKYLPLELMDTRAQKTMEKAASGKYHDFFEVTLTFDVVCLRYFFELIDTQGKRIYYGNYEFYREKIEDIDRMYDCPQNLREEECFYVPKWAKNKVIYQIFPSRFATSKEIKESVWYQAPIDLYADLKGDLKGIIQHLEHIKELGADVIYMTPIFRSDTSHKYDIIDYYQIDPSFGTIEDLKELTKRAHQAGMYVILDGVFNHTSQKFFAFADIIKKGKASPYWNWYYIKDYPLQMKWGEKPNFKCFSYFGGMPKLNLNNPETREYMIQVACYWIKECHIDGWRLDVGDEISHDFWNCFRKRVRAVYSDALLVGEVWHYAGDFLEGDEWDSVMNYPFYLAVKDFVALEKLSAFEFLGELGFIRGNSHIDSYQTLFNLIDSHDTARFFSLCGEKKEKLKLAAALQLLLPGAPMIYYGDEYAMAGVSESDCRRGMLWDEKRQNTEIYQWYRTLIQVRKEYGWILNGKIKKERAVETEETIILEKSGTDGEGVLLFHGREGVCTYKEYTGWRNLLTKENFSGRLNGYEAAVLMPFEK